MLTWYSRSVRPVNVTSFIQPDLVEHKPNTVIFPHVLIAVTSVKTSKYLSVGEVV